MLQKSIHPGRHPLACDRLLRACRLAFLVFAAGTLSAQSTPPPRVVESAAALPRLTYRLPVRPSRMIRDASLMATLAAEVERSSGRLLEEYQIRDPSTRRDLYAARRTAALVRGDLAAALAFDGAAAESTVPGLATDLLVAALSAPSINRGSGGDAVVRSALRARLDLRGDEARDDVIALRRELALASSAFRLGEVAAFADPEWQRSPAVGQDFAVAMLRLWTEINLRNPRLDALEAELVDWLGRHAASVGDVWTGRDIAIDRDTAGPVTLAVWDGIDPRVFAGRLGSDPREQPNGRDDDGDGFIDEAEGLAFDEHFRPAAGSLLPVPAVLEGRLSDYERYMRGIGELAAGLDSPDVAFARAWRRRLAPAQVEEFEQGYRFYTNYIHGTHVAGVALRGLPAVSLVPIRITFSDSSPPPLLDEAAARRFASMVATAARYLRSRGARLCNISWGFTPQDVEANLAQNGIEPDPEARARRAQRIFEIMLDGMEQAIAGAPDILFVVAAGNARQDIDFVRDLPGSINLPNLLTVGAADTRGRAASFASTGESVDLFAPGTDIESVVPGGGRLLWSGASLAAPQVVNAAAKLLAIEPRLSAADLARLLTETASPAPGSELPLLNVRAARARLTGPGRSTTAE